MKPPRAQLRAYLAEAFSDSLKYFVSDYFKEAAASIPWSEGREAQSEALISWLDERTRIAQLWPVLKEDRPQHRDRIEQIEAAWASAAPPGGELEDWLARYATDLDTKLGEKLRGNPTWRADVRFIDIRVRERSTGKPQTERFVGTLDAALDAVERRIVLVGDGGSGKTTILVDAAAMMARRAIEDPTAPIPLYMRLNFFDATERALDGLLDELARASGLTQPLVRDVRSGERSCCFLLDGLNEVRREFRDSCISAIEKLVRGQHRCIVTSRPIADVDELVRRIAPATVLDMAPLTEGQIRAVLHRHGLLSIADRLGDRLPGLAETPFLLAAIVQTYEGVDPDRLPTSVPQLYRTLIDDYVFTRRELEKPHDVRPTTYDYQRVKRPILAQLALRMRREGVTRIPEDRALLRFLRSELERLRQAFDGELEIMPDRPVAKQFLDEVILNGILTREDATLEFWHESVLDYYAGIGLASLPAEEIAALVPPLIWRRLDLGYHELSVPDAFTEAIAMHLGLVASSRELLSLVAERSPLVAARCVGVAGLHDTPSARALMQRWFTLLGHHQPIRRWVACQCLQRAGNTDEDTGQLLVELALSDPVANVAQAAMRALSACPHVRPLEKLVAALIAHQGTSWRDDPGRNLYSLRSAIVVRLLTERRARATTSGRERARAEKLLATMDLEFVSDALGRIDGAAAKDALQALPEWDFIGVNARQIRRIAERARTAFEASRRRHLEGLSIAALEDLRRALHDGSEIERIAALELLDERLALTADRLLDVVLRDPSRRVRSLAEVILLKRPPEVWSARWHDLMNDSAWTQRFHVPIDLEPDLCAGELSASWIAALGAHGIQAEDLQCGPALQGWLLEPYVTSGEQYESELYQVIRTATELTVLDAGARPRVAILGARLGERALPALDRLLEENPPCAEIAVFEAWRRIGTDAAIGRLSKYLEPGAINVAAVKAIAGSRHPSAKTRLMEALDAIRWSSSGPEDRAAYVVRHLTDTLIGLAATDELYQRIGPMFDSTDADRRLVAAHVLARATEAEYPRYDLVVRASRDADPRVRVIGMTLLATTQDAVGRDLLFHACVSEPVHEVWMAACTSFRRACDDDDLLRLRAARHDPDRDARARVIGALAQVCDDTAIPDLCEALLDSDVEIRVSAAAGLHKLSEVLSSATLEDLAISARVASDLRIRQLAADVLRGAGDLVRLPDAPTRPAT